MNKALDALKELGNYRIDDDMFIDFCIKDTNEYDIIKTELEDYDDIKHMCNFYDIEFNLRNIREALFTFAQLKGEYGTHWGNYNDKLKAFEIIKEIMNNDINYKLNANSRKILKEIFESLPKEKQDLLKETLCK